MQSSQAYSNKHLVLTGAFNDRRIEAFNEFVPDDVGKCMPHPPPPHPGGKPADLKTGTSAGLRLAWTVCTLAGCLQAQDLHAPVFKILRRGRKEASALQ